MDTTALGIPLTSFERRKGLVPSGPAAPPPLCCCESPKGEDARGTPSPFIIALLR